MSELDNIFINEIKRIVSKSFEMTFAEVKRANTRQRKLARYYCAYLMYRNTDLNTTQIGDILMRSISGVSEAKEHISLHKLVDPFFYNYIRTQLIEATEEACQNM